MNIGDGFKHLMLEKLGLWNCWWECFHHILGVKSPSYVFSLSHILFVCCIFLIIAYISLSISLYPSKISYFLFFSNVP
jgi:hypothetical protein